MIKYFIDVFSSMFHVIDLSSIDILSRFAFEEATTDGYQMQDYDCFVMKCLDHETANIISMNLSKCFIVTIVLIINS